MVFIFVCILIERIRVRVQCIQIKCITKIEIFRQTVPPHMVIHYQCTYELKNVKKTCLYGFYSRCCLRLKEIKLCVPVWRMCERVYILVCVNMIQKVVDRRERILKETSGFRSRVCLYAGLLIMITIISCYSKYVPTLLHMYTTTHYGIF